MNFKVGVRKSSLKKIILKAPQAIYLKFIVKYIIFPKKQSQREENCMYLFCPLYPKEIVHPLGGRFLLVEVGSGFFYF